MVVTKAVVAAQVCRASILVGEASVSFIDCVDQFVLEGCGLPHIDVQLVNNALGVRRVGCCCLQLGWYAVAYRR